MGGTALGRRAQSLTSPQFDKLASFCKSQLTTLFPDIRIEYCPRDKLIHGDVDLLCSWDGVGVGQHIGGYDRSDEDKGTHPVLRALAFEMMNLLGGVKWVRKSDQVNIAIPCNVIGVKGTDEQVSKRLIKESQLSVSRSSKSTSISSLLLRSTCVYFSCRIDLILSSSLEPSPRFPLPSSYTNPDSSLNTPSKSVNPPSRSPSPHQPRGFATGAGWIGRRLGCSIPKQSCIDG